MRFIDRYSSLSNHPGTPIHCLASAHSSPRHRHHRTPTDYFVTLDQNPSKRRHLLQIVVIVSTVLIVSLFALRWALSDHWFVSAQTAMESGRYEEAEQYFEKSATWGDRDAEAALGLARIKTRSGDFEAAGNWIQRAVSEGADKSAIEREQLILSLYSGAARERLDELLDAVDAAENDAPAVLEAYAAGFYSLNEPIMAMEILDRWLSVNPKAARAHLWRGRVLQSIGDLDSAVTAYKESIRHDPAQREAKSEFDSAVQKQAEASKSEAILRDATKKEI